MFLRSQGEVICFLFFLICSRVISPQVLFYCSYVLLVVVLFFVVSLGSICASQAFWCFRFPEIVVEKLKKSGNLRGVVQAGYGF